MQINEYNMVLHLIIEAILLVFRCYTITFIKISNSSIDTVSALVCTMKVADTPQNGVTCLRIPNIMTLLLLVHDVLYLQVKKE